MGRFCTQCGNELTEIADVCLGCGRLVSKREIFKNDVSNTDGKAVGTLSIIFGVLGLYPLIFIGSFIGVALSLICLISASNSFKRCSKVGLIISLSTLFFWIFLIVLIIILIANSNVNYY